MPIVKTNKGVKHFPYTKAGKKAAKEMKKKMKKPSKEMIKKMGY